MLLLNRPSARATRAEELVRSVAAQAGSRSVVKTIACDMQSIESVKHCALAVLGECPDGLDVLANNAGVMAMNDQRTPDGYDVQMQTNQLTHVLLTKLLMPKLEQAAVARGEARVVFHSSAARDGPPGDLEPRYFYACESGSLGGDKKGAPWMRYHQTKLANAAFAMALHERLVARGSKVKAMACDPGYAVTELTATSQTMSDSMRQAAAAQSQSAADGSMPLVHCCFDLSAQSGDFYLPMTGLVGPVKQSISRGVPLKEGTEKLTASKLSQSIAWNESMKFPGVEPFFVDRKAAL